MKQQEVKEILDFEGRVYEELKDYVNAYLGWVEKNIPNQYYNLFGVGVAGSHSQFGKHYGFSNGRNHYAVPGHGYNIANDFNARVSGCTNRRELSKFVKDIPDWMQNGIKEIEVQNKLSVDAMKEAKEKLKDLF